MNTLYLIKENGYYVAIDESDYLMHYGRKGMKRGMSIYQEDYVPIGKIAENKDLARDAKRHRVAARYVNKDGTLNETGEIRYKYSGDKYHRDYRTQARNISNAYGMNIQRVQGKINRNTNKLNKIQSKYTNGDAINIEDQKKVARLKSKNEANAKIKKEYENAEKTEMLLLKNPVSNESVAYMSNAKKKANAAYVKNILLYSVFGMSAIGLMETEQEATTNVSASKELEKNIRRDERRDWNQKKQQYT